MVVDGATCLELFCDRGRAPSRPCGLFTLFDSAAHSSCVVSSSYLLLLSVTSPVRESRYDSLVPNSRSRTQCNSTHQPETSQSQIEYSKCTDVPNPIHSISQSFPPQSSNYQYPTHRMDSVGRVGPRAERMEGSHTGTPLAMGFERYALIFLAETAPPRPLGPKGEAYFPSAGKTYRFGFAG
jgi:hypothetical protein